MNRKEKLVYENKQQNNADSPIIYNSVVEPRGFVEGGHRQTTLLGFTSGVPWK